jgi:hypothetical protein
MQRRTARGFRIVIATVVVCACSLLVARGAFAIAPPDEESELEAVQSVQPYEPAHVPDPHDPTRAMHPVRVAAYALHPIGVALDWMIVRPAVWVARQEPFRTIFGYED